MKQLLMAITLLLLWVFLYDYAEGKELPKEMSMATEAGEIVLTTTECTFTKLGLQGYDYAAYATDRGHPNHEGCWKSDSYEGIRAVYIFFSDINQTAVFDARLFKPKTNI